WTRLGLESMLLGAHAEGVRNILAITGDPPEVGDYPGSRGVYEVDSVGLTRLIAGMNRGEDFNGRPIDAPTSFFVGVAVNPTADDLEAEAQRFREKIAAGAQFAMTQIVFDLDELDRFASAAGGWEIPVLAGIFPLTSYRLALRLHNEVPGIIVPQALLLLEQQQADAAQDLGGGAFQGASVESRYGPIEVTISVAGGKITDCKGSWDIDIPRSIQIDTAAFPLLQTDCISTGTAKLHQISGATLSVNAFIASLQSALVKAHVSTVGAIQLGPY